MASTFSNGGFSASQEECLAYVKMRRQLGSSLRSIQNDFDTAFGSNGPLLYNIKEWYSQAGTASSSSRQSKNDQHMRRRVSGMMLQTSIRRPSLSSTVVHIKQLTEAVDDFDNALNQELSAWRDIVNRQMARGQLYEDPKFRPHAKSILYDSLHPGVMFLSHRNKNPGFSETNIEWKRFYHQELSRSHETDDSWDWLIRQQENQLLAPEDENSWVVFRENTTPHDISQGILGDCWFVSAMSLIVLHNLPLQQIVMTPFFQPAGVYAMRLCIDGRWKVIIVDDKFPTWQGRVLFSKCTRKQMWPALIEKALAKSYGCYEALVGGHCREGLSTLTGQTVESMFLPEKSTHSNEIDKAWHKLKKSIESNFLIGAVCGRSTLRGQQPYDSVGLVSQHAYSLLAITSLVNRQQRRRLVCLRNPWGKSDWKGEWSDASSKWQTHCPPEKKAELNPTLQGDGIFWMSFSDFLTYFDSVDICKLRPDWQETRFTAPFYRQPGRSCLVVLLTIIEPTTIAVMLHQLDLRKLPSDKRKPLDLTIFICEVDSKTGNPRDIEPVKIVGTSADGRETANTISFVDAGDFELKEGWYAVVAVSFEAALESGARDDHCFSVAVHSDQALIGETATVQSSFLGKVLVSFVANQGSKTVLSTNGLETLAIYKTSKFGSGFSIVVENSTPDWHYVKLDASSSLGLVSHVRGDLVTEDIIPPKCYQLIQVFTPKKDKPSSCNLKTSIMYRPAKREETSASAPKFRPALSNSSRPFVVNVKIN